MATGGNVGDSVEKESVLSACLEELQNEHDEHTVRAALETLLRLANNAIQHPSEEKYRKLRTENKAFNTKLWSLPEARQFLMVWGWIEADDVIVLPKDSDLQLIKQLLHNKLSSLQSTKVKNDTQEALSEKEKAILEERKKLREKAKLEKMEKERIKAQILADRKNIKSRELQDSKATKFHGDGHMTKFKDIGVDLGESGGG